MLLLLFFLIASPGSKMLLTVFDFSNMNRCLLIDNFWTSSLQKKSINGGTCIQVYICILTCRRQVCSYVYISFMYLLDSIVILSLLRQYLIYVDLTSIRKHLSTNLFLSCMQTVVLESHTDQISFLVPSTLSFFYFRKLFSRRIM